MKVNIGTKYEGDFLTADEFNQVVDGINTLNLGDLANVDDSVDDSVTENSILVKDKSTDLITLKPLSYVGSSHSHTNYLNKSGDTMTGALIANYGKSNTGVKIGTTYINAIGASVIYQNNKAIRFGAGGAWDLNNWAGLRYISSNNTIYLGTADGSIFDNNSASSIVTTDARLMTPNVSKMYVGTSNLVLHSGNYTEYCAKAGHTHSYSPSNHTHNISDIPDLQTTLNSKAPSNHTHSNYAYNTHTHTISYISGLQTKLDEMQTAIDGKSATSHNHDSLYMPKTGGTVTGGLNVESLVAEDGYITALNGWFLTCTNGTGLYNSYGKAELYYESNWGGWKMNTGLHAEGDIKCYLYYTISDRKFKSNIKPLENRGELKPVTFNMNGKECIGFVAQDVLELYPELVSDNGEYLALNYAQLTAVLAVLINELRKELDLLKKNVLA